MAYQWTQADTKPGASTESVCIDATRRDQEPEKKTVVKFAQSLWRREAALLVGETIKLTG